MDKPKKYCPSNGTEGEMFFSEFCYQCIHEKFSHTQKHGDKQCDIMSNSLLYYPSEEGFPKEWIYDENNRPTCTAFKKWDWGNDGDPDDPGNPKYSPPDDPNQLCMPFDIVDILNESEVKV